MANVVRKRGERMPIYITQGRYTRDAIKGMIIKPEDRSDQVGRLLSKVGGKLLGEQRRLVGERRNEHARAGREGVDEPRHRHAGCRAATRACPLTSSRPSPARARSA